MANNLTREQSINKAGLRGKLYVCTAKTYDPDKAFHADVVLKDGKVIKNRFGYTDDEARSSTPLYKFLTGAKSS